MNPHVIELPKPTERRKHDRTRALRRRPSFRPPEEGDMRWLYAGYMQGAFPTLFQRGLSPKDFTKALVARFQQPDTKHFMLEAPTSLDTRIAGMIEAMVDLDKMEPHVLWLPWATPRNKLETLLHFLNEVRRTHESIIIADPDDKAFFETLCRYAVIRRVGTLERWVRGQDTPLFQTRKPKEA